MEGYKYKIESIYKINTDENCSQSKTTSHASSSSDPQNWNFATTTDVVWTTNHTAFVPYTSTDFNLDQDIYPKLPNALGVIYVEEGEIKCRTPEGDDILLGRMDDGDDKVSINIIAIIAKRLLEKNK